LSAASSFNNIPKIGWDTMNNYEDTAYKNRFQTCQGVEIINLEVEK